MTALPLYALGIVLSALALYVARASSASVNRRFAVFAVTVAGWTFGIAGVETGTNTELWGRVTFASASLIPAALVRFSHVFPQPSPWPSHLFRVSVTAAGCTLALLSAATPLIAYDVVRTGAGIQRTPGFLYPVFALYFLFSSALSLAAFVSRWSKTRGRARAQLQYLVSGLVIIALGATSTNLILPLLTGRSNYSWLGPYFTLPLVVLVAHAIIRHRLMDLRLIVHRGLAHGLVITVVATGLIYVVRVIYGRPEPDSHRIDALVALAVALAMLSAPAQLVVGRFIDTYLYRGRVDYESALRHATHLLGRLMEPRGFADELRKLLTETVVPEHFTLLLHRPDGHFECLSTDLAVPMIDRISSVVGHLATADRRSPITLVLPKSGSGRVAADVLHSAGVEVTAILRRHDAVLGVALLGARRSGDAYFAKELTFLESLSELAAIALENTLLYQQRIQMLEYSERLLESLESAVVAVDLGGSITSYNPAAVGLLSLPCHQRDLTLDVLPGEVAWALALAVRNAWLAKDIEITITRTEGGTLPAVLSTAVLRDAHRDLTGALVIVTDLSTVKALERNERRLEHLSLMARFYAGIAHEIRNPLAAISNFISMLPDRFDDPEYRDIATRLLPAEVARIVGLAERLRLMAPSAGGKLAPISIRPLLADIVAIHTPVLQDTNISIVLECPDNIGRIHGDPNQLVQLFVNLIKNAIDSMSSGGTITVDVREVANGAVLASVIDEGSGIDPAIRGKIFEPFFTTKSAGSGLGLAICREIASFHGAALSLVPRPGRRGTVAQVEFPCAQDSYQVMSLASRDTVTA